MTAPKQLRQFSHGASAHQRRKMSKAHEEEGHFAPALTTLFLGISVYIEDSTAVVALAAHDAVYLVDFAVHRVPLGDAKTNPDNILTDHIVKNTRAYSKEHFVKFIGAGVPTHLHHLSPTLCSRLWLDLDIVPIVMNPEGESSSCDGYKKYWDVKSIEEQAESMSRRCVMNFGPSLVPLLQVGFRGIVQTDAGCRAQLTRLDDHKGTCGAATWDAMMHYANVLRDRKLKVAFFSSTPQGGGVALMRHALVRFSRVVGVDLKWYVPKPRPGIFRTTKDVHNVLQGVANPEKRITKEEKAAIIDWIVESANRFWLSEGGPLRPPEEGGADVIMIDDPQMPGLIPLIKKATPNRPVLFRSHIQIRSDLCAKAGSPQADVWDWLWDNIKHADMFISHPIPEFVPKNVPRDMVAYMPATTDWLDGLNKPMDPFDAGYYGHMYNVQCHSQRVAKLKYPARKYIVQVARFDPSKGLPTVIDAYAEFRRLCDEMGVKDVPQLCICGNGSVDDPDANMVYDQAMEQLEENYPHLIEDCSITHLEPDDQLLNAILAHAHVALQLSTREGFEVKVSEALHAGRPVIATRAGGIPLQVKEDVNGFLVEPGDSKAVADCLYRLFTDDKLHSRMSEAARTGVSDEVGTVGNALSWYYLAAKWNEMGVKPGLKGNHKWVNDMAREEAGKPYGKAENRLPRSFTEKA